MFGRPDEGRLVGSIVLGRVESVLPGLQAAFVDIGLAKAGFLHAQDVSAQPFLNGFESPRDRNGAPRGGEKESKGKIQDLLSKGQEVLVKVTKDAISGKGPRVSMRISIPGHFLVYLPREELVGVSRKIANAKERTRLRRMGREMREEESGSGGLIIRTASRELTAERMKREYRSLRRQWDSIVRKAADESAPSVIHQELSVLSGFLRDLFTDQVDEVVIDDKRAYERAVRYVRGFDRKLAKRIRRHRGPKALFDRYGVEGALRRSMARKVFLPSRGHIVIEQTEALVAVDVNTGKFTSGRAGGPILRTNLEAAREVAKQARLRDIGGIIIIDFIDMDTEEEREQVLAELRAHLARDRAKTRAWGISELGLVEMSRQRVRPSLLQSLTEPCPHCNGTGRILTPEALLREVERSVNRYATAENGKRLLLRLHPRVVLHMREREPEYIKAIRSRTRVRLRLQDDPLLERGDYQLLSGKERIDVTAKFSENGRPGRR